MHDDGSQPFFELPGGTAGCLPVVLSSPHSGIQLPLEAGVELNVTQSVLEALDDGPTDQLLEAARGFGATVLAARFARAFVDLNRNPNEIDPAHMDHEALPGLAESTPKVEVGLGVIPSRIAGRPIYRRPLGLSRLECRLHRAYFPYHERLWRLVQERRSLAQGNALLLDCHSMPPEAAIYSGQRGMLDITLGDRFGVSAHPSLVDAAADILIKAGFAVSRNRPYAGGFITENYGRPQFGMHAIQIEMRRDLFFDRRTRALTAGAGQLSEVLARLVTVLSDMLLSFKNVCASWPFEPVRSPLPSLP